MELGPAVFEISSEDEELTAPPTTRGDDNHDWLKDILSALEKDDDDDVVVVSEKKPRGTKDLDENKFSDDEDCVVLDCDPDKHKDVVVDEEKKKKNNVGDCGDIYDDNDDRDSDDLQIVGEKGQIACRDFPHPRHLCIKYPFNSSPHEKHCDLCHCYVCDAVAPCMHWNTGMPNIDHCHATDKEGKWVCERKFLKSLNNASHPVSRYPHLNLRPLVQHSTEQSELPDPYQISQFNHVSQTNQISSVGVVQLGPNCVSHNQVPRQPTIRVCSSQTNVGVPNIATQCGRNQHEFVAIRSRFQPHLVARQLNGVSVLQRDRNRNIGNLGLQSTNSHAMFKRPGSIQGTMTRNQVMPRPMINVNHAQAMQYRRNYNTTDTSVHNNLTRLERLYPCASSLVNQSSQQKVHKAFAANTEPRQPHLFPQAQNNFQGGTLTGNSMHYDTSYVQANQSDRRHDSHGIYYQCGNQNVVQESVHVNPEWQRNLSQTDQLCGNIGLLHSNEQSATGSQQLYSQITQQSTVDSFQLHIQSSQQAAVDCLDVHSNSDQQPVSDSLHHQSQSNLQSPLEIYGTVSAEATELDSHCINLSVLDFDIADNSSDSVVGGLPPQMNILSPESMSFDENLFNNEYDFCWNDMTPS